MKLDATYVLSGFVLCGICSAAAGVCWVEEDGTSCDLIIKQYHDPSCPETPEVLQEDPATVVKETDSGGYARAQSIALLRMCATMYWTREEDGECHEHRIDTPYTFDQKVSGPRCATDPVGPAE